MASEAGGEQVRGIGARLRSAREKKGLTVLQAAEKLHVDVRLLESLEAEQFSTLGAAVYVRGHMRRYADLVGESPTQLQQLYDETTHTVEPDLTRIPRRERDGDPSRLMVPALLILAGFALAGILWWLLSMQAGKAAPVRTLQPVTVAAVAGAGTSPAPGTMINVAAATSAVEAPAGAAPPPAPAGSTPAHAGSAAPSAGAAQLALKFAAASWVDIYEAGGRRLLHGVEAAGSARTLTGKAPLRVVLGNAHGVALELNGQTVALDGLVHSDGSAHIVIDRTGRAAAAHRG